MTSLNDVLETTALQKVAGNMIFTEGPLWHPDGFFYFVDIRTNSLYRMTLGQTPEKVRTTEGGNGTTFDLQGRLIHCEGEGRKVMLAAGDTFRAAAVEQLKVWGDRAGVPVVSKGPGADAAGLAYEALERARAENCDVLLIDTAGRLHNKTNLMDELAKVVRVIRKLDPASPHSCLLVLDATTGQNAHAQVETFKNMSPVDALVLTKLDGSAKGGVLVALAEKFGLPVVAIGVGEGIDDLRPFEARAFARGLMGLTA